MDKKRKTDLPMPAPERGRVCDGTEGRKKTRKSRSEELDFFSEGTDGGDEQLQDVTEADRSEGNNKAKIRTGTKRTKKPPKSLENYICRPSVRVFQRPESVGQSVCKGRDGISAKTRRYSQLCPPVQKKYNSDSLATKDNSAITNTDPSAHSPSSVLPSNIMSPASDSSTARAAKKVHPKQTKKTDLKSDKPLQETPKSPKKLSVSHKIMGNTQIKQGHYKNPPDSNSASQQDSNPRECINVLNDKTQQGQVSPNSSYGNPSGTSLHTVSSKLTSCFQKNDSKCNESHSEMSSSLHLNTKKGEGCMDDLNNVNVRVLTNEKSDHQNASAEEPSPCTNDLPEHPTPFQVTDSPSSSKCTDIASDLAENIRGSKGQNENKHLKWSSDTTMKALKNPEHKNYRSTNGSGNDEHGKPVKLRTSHDEQIEVNCLTDTNNTVCSTLNPESSAQVEPPMDDLSSNSKQDKNLLKKQQVRSLRSNKIADVANEINHSPVASKVPQSGPQNETPFHSPSESFSSNQCLKTLPSQISKNCNSEISVNNPPSRKRGRPKINRSGGQFQANNSQTSVFNPNDQNPEDQELELDMKQRRPVARKRGRPKQSFSVQAQETQPELILKKQDSGDLHITSKDKIRSLQKSKKSKRVIMKTLIGKINRLNVKRKDQMLTRILLGQKQCDRDVSREGTERDACCPDSPPTHSLSSLVSSFGGKLGSQINVSKRGTIYMGKRRGRKPKSQTTSKISFQKSQQMFSDNPQFTPRSTFGQPSADTKRTPVTGSSGTFKNITSSSLPGRSSQINFSTPKVKATSFKQLSDNAQAQGEVTLMCNSGEGINDNVTSDRGERKNRLSGGMGFCSAPATSSVFTMTGSSSLQDKPKALSSLPSEHLFSAHLPLGSGRPQDSSPLLTFTDQEAHKFKCHRKGHHCLSREKLKRHKYKCKKKYMQLRAKCQDPEFLADIEDLVVRLSKIRIVQRITRTKLGDDGNTAGRKTVKGKCQSCDLQCLQEKVHPPAMFQINLSGYYSPHSALTCEPLHYVRMANMRRKHGCSSEPSEQIVTHFPVMHKLGYPYPGGGFIHPSYKVPLTTTSLGFGLCRGYPSNPALYPLPFPPYLHHYSKNPIISPSKFHKKRIKFPRQDSTGWGQNNLGGYPRMNPHSSCDCFNTEGVQRQKLKEKGRVRLDKHSIMTERQDACLWLNKPTKDNETSGSSSFNSPSPSPNFSQSQQKDKTFHFPRLNPSCPQCPSLGQGEEVRWSEHQPSWGLGNKNLNQSPKTLEINTAGHGNTLKGPESDVNSTSSQQLHRRTKSFLKQPTLISGIPSQQRTTKSRRSEGLTGLSSVLKEHYKITVQGLSSGDKRTPGIDQAAAFFKKHQCSDSSSSREPEKIPREPKGFKAKRRPLIKNKSNYVCQTSPLLSDDHEHPAAKNTPSTSARVQQHFTPNQLTHQSLEGQEDTDGSEVKRRGPGRPRKSPKLSSPPSLPSAPDLSATLTIGKAGGEDKDNSDTVLRVIERVIQGEQRSGKKRKIAESVGDGNQNQNEDTDVTEKASMHCHMCSASTDPSLTKDEDSQPEQAAASIPIKKYLWAGLYSDDYKTEDIPERPHEINVEDLEYNPEEHKYGLLPAPLHVGKYLRVKRINFQLPYDIHWQCARNKLCEKTLSPPQATPSNSSCNLPNSSVPLSCSGECLNTPLSDDETQSCDKGSHTGVHEEHHQCFNFNQQEESSDNENFPSTLSSEERSFVMKHSVFLVRNYEKMKARQAFLLREGAREEEKEQDEDKASSLSESKGHGEDPTIKSGGCPVECTSCSGEGEHSKTVTFQSRNLSQTLQEIWDRIVSCKGSSGQTLSDPLLNLCSRKRSDSALVDLSMVQKQLQSGHYESLAAFHSDMLTVFHCAEKYYGSESAVGRDVSQLRAVYHRAHQEASAHISNFL